MLDVMVDSNVIYSGLVFKGKPARVLKVILDGKLRLVIPEDQLEELYVLFKRKSPDSLYLLEAYVSLQRVKIVSAEKYLKKIKTALKLTRDKKDAPYIACALLIKPKYLVTGDKDFQTETIKRRLNILTPREFLTIIERG
ncbi:MAG: putative toxin-antitoxin system toxin component, PIN family [Thermoproteota archaeon]